MPNRTDYQINIIGKSDELVKALGAATEALKKTQKQSEDNKVSFSEVAATAAAAFATIKFVVLDSVEAFFEAEKASRQLDQALKANGVSKYKDDYKALADQLTDLIGIDDDVAIAAFAQGQSMLGNIKITQELTKAVADFSSLRGLEFSEVFAKVTKTVGTSTNALAKLGIEVDNGGTKQQRLAEIIEQLNGKARGQAEASQTGEVAFKRLGVAVGNLKEAIGEQLAPILIKAANALTDFFKQLKGNDELVKTIANIALIAGAMLGLVAAVNTGIYVVGLLRNAFIALDVVLTANPIGASIVGIVALGAAVAYFSNEIIAGAQAAIAAFVTFISGAFTGVSSIIQGVLTFDPKSIAVGLKQIKTAVNDGIDAAKNEYVRRKAELDGAKSSLTEAPKPQESKPSVKRGERELVVAENELIKLEIDRATKERIELKKQEVEILKKLDTEHNESQRQLLRQQLDDVRQQEERARTQDAENREQYQQQILAKDAEYLALSGEQQAEYQRLYGAQLIQAQQGEQEVKLKTINENQKRETEENARFIKDRQKFGVTYAAINKALYSDEVKNFSESSNQMAQLSQSKNATLKSIGKAYALSNIAISTAEMATKAYASLAGIPLIGPVLGGIAAAAAIAFGAERTADVLAANSGGIVPGAGPNQDSVSAFLTPGELVVPRNNFDEVVNAVASQRAGASQGSDQLINKLDQLISVVGQPVNATISGGSGRDPLLEIFESLNYYLEFKNFRLYGVNS